jgi:hypothetical protein
MFPEPLLRVESERGKIFLPLSSAAIDVVYCRLLPKYGLLKEETVFCGMGFRMRVSLRQKIIEVCDRKIAEKGPGVGLSFYAFFANRNDDPELLMEAAGWWIRTHRLDHFEKAIKIKAMVEEMA